MTNVNCLGNWRSVPAFKVPFNLNVMVHVFCCLRLAAQDSSSDRVGLQCSRPGGRRQSPCSRRFPGVTRKPRVDGGVSVWPAGTTQRHHAARVEQSGSRRERRRVTSRRHGPRQHHIPREETASFVRRHGKN